MQRRCYRERCDLQWRVARGSANSILAAAGGAAAGGAAAGAAGGAGIDGDGNNGEVR